MTKQYSQAKLALAPRAQRATITVISNLREQAERAREYAAAARAPRTRATYASRWRAFEAWCVAYQLSSLPCAPATLALYLTSEAQRGLKVPSLGSAISAIAAAHSAAGIPRTAHPHRDPQVAEIWRGIRRAHGTAPRRVAPLVIGELRRLVDVLDNDTLSGKRDRALLAIGFAGAFRRSELVALEVSDVEFVQEGLKVTIRRSKTDQEGHGVTIGLPIGRNAATCPVRTLRAWLDAAGITEGPLFRKIDRHGNVGARALAGRAVAIIVQRTAAEAGVSGDFAGHSLRSGLATSSAQAGKSDRAIMTQGRWSGRAMVDRYVRDGRLFGEHNAADGL